MITSLYLFVLSSGIISNKPFIPSTAVFKAVFIIGTIFFSSGYKSPWYSKYVVSTKILICLYSFALFERVLVLFVFFEIGNFKFWDKRLSHLLFYLFWMNLMSTCNMSFLYQEYRVNRFFLWATLKSGFKPLLIDTQQRTLQCGVRLNTKSPCKKHL